MTRLLPVLILLLLSGGPAFSQEPKSTSNHVPPAASATVGQAVSAPNPLFVTDQVTRHQSVSGGSNLFQAIDARLGLGNSAHITQIGEGNATIFEQYGKQNVASFFLDGNRNDLSAIQNGTGNLLDVSVLGNDNRLPILQDGHGLALRLTLDATNVRLPAAIEQTGTGGIPIIIEHGPVSTP
jgi:hypothetical protein